MLGLRRQGLDSNPASGGHCHSSHHPQEVLLVQFSLYVHKGGLKHNSFHFFEAQFISFYLKRDYLLFMLRREVACSASGDRQGSNFESCVWRTVSSQSSHHPQEVLLAQFSLYVHKGGLKPDSFHFFEAQFISFYLKRDYLLFMLKELFPEANPMPA